MEQQAEGGALPVSKCAAKKGRETEYSQNKARVCKSNRDTTSIAGVMRDDDRALKSDIEF